MKNSIKLITLLLGLILVFGTSCKKYEEGPNISLLSKKSRLVNKWKPDRSVDEFGNDDALSQEAKDGVIFEFKKNNTFTIKYNFPGYSDLESGTWEFTDKKEKIVLTYLDDGEAYVYTILLLKKNELGLKDTSGYKTYFITK